jgi:hypothetical protein
MPQCLKTVFILLDPGLFQSSSACITQWIISVIILMKLLSFLVEFVADRTGIFGRNPQAVFLERTI